MAYTKTNWTSTTPINTTNLNKMEQGIYENSISNIYSTSEQKIGTWIDGKPLYRKVIDCGTLPTTAGNTTVNTGLTNVNVVKIEGYMYRDNSVSTLPYSYSGATDIYHYYNPTTNKVTIRASGEIPVTSVIEILEYTKN